MTTGYSSTELFLPSSVSAQRSLKFRASALLQLCLPLVAAGLLSACGSQSADSPSLPPTFTNVYANSFAGCNSCHSPGQASYDVSGVHLDFTTQATAYSTLRSWRTGSAASGADCNGIVTVSPGSPQASYVEAMVDPTYRKSPFPGGSGAGCTPYDHSGFVNLSQASKSLLSAWIQNGANND